MKHFYKISVAALAVVLSMPAAVNAQIKVATFEDLQTAEGANYWMGPASNAKEEVGKWDMINQVGTIQSGSFEFSNSYNAAYSSWTGMGYSKSTSTDFSSATYLVDQFNSSVGHGVDGSAQFGVAYSGGTITVKGSAEGENVNGCYITNNTYAVSSMENGDSYAKKFATGDYFKVIFTGKKADETTSTVDFYLADFRSEDASKHYIVKDWTYVDLSSLGKVVSLSYAFESTDVGSYGINTPTYFCIDNLGAEKPTTGISHPAGNLIELREVARYTLDGKRIQAPQKGINIIRMSDGSTRKVVVK